jgi:hypothetical protein
VAWPEPVKPWTHAFSLPRLAGAVDHGACRCLPCCGLRVQWSMWCLSCYPTTTDCFQAADNQAERDAQAERGGRRGGWQLPAYLMLLGSTVQGCKPSGLCSTQLGTNKVGPTACVGPGWGLGWGQFAVSLLACMLCTQHVCLCVCPQQGTECMLCCHPKEDGRMREQQHYRWPALADAGAASVSTCQPSSNGWR